MPTTNLGLPLIVGNQSADVVRDMNALAEEIDLKASSAEELATHKAENTIDAHNAINISLTSTNFTATDVKSGMEELFQYGNDGKTLLETTLIAKKATVSKVGSVATFAELNDGIGQLRDAHITTLLYDSGDEKTTLTGGWVSGAYQGGDSPTYTKQPGNLKVLALGTNSTGSNGAFATTNLMNLDAFSKLYVEWELVSAVKGSALFVVHTTKTFNTYSARYISSIDIPFTRKIDELDVSSLNGNYYVGAGIQGNVNNNVDLRVYKIWGEE